MRRTRRAINPGVPPPERPAGSAPGVFRGILAALVNCALCASGGAWISAPDGIFLGLVFQALPAVGIAVAFWGGRLPWGALSVVITSMIVFVAVSGTAIAARIAGVA